MQGQVIIYNSQRNFTCKWNACRMVCENISKLIEHVDGHLEKQDRPRVCKWGGCGSRMGAIGPTRIHVLNHLGVRSLCCPDCGHYFSRKDALTRHIKKFHMKKDHVLPNPSCGEPSHAELEPKPFDDGSLNLPTAAMAAVAAVVAEKKKKLKRAASELLEQYQEHKKIARDIKTVFRDVRTTVVEAKKMCRGPTKPRGSEVNSSGARANLKDEKGASSDDSDLDSDSHDSD